MRGSTGMSTGGPDTPSRMEKHKAVIILGLLVRKVQIGPLARRHLSDVSLAGRWLPVLVTFCVRASLLQ